MNKRCGLLLLFVSCVFADDLYRNGLNGGSDSVINKRFAYWPSVHNAAAIFRIRRQTQVPVANGDIAGPNEGNAGDPKLSQDPITNIIGNMTTIHPSPNVESTTKLDKLDQSSVKLNHTKGNTTEATFSNSTTTILPTKASTINTTINAEPTKKMDPGVVKRGLIVFGGFALLAMAYFIFYRTKNNYSETAKAVGNNDVNQFRYGILQSEDQREDKLKLMPGLLDGEESDEDDDEDLEIFDLEQKKKSLSYVNLQATDEEIVMSPKENSEREDLLLDIEGANSDTLINWSTSGSKSIL